MTRPWFAVALVFCSPMAAFATAADTPADTVPDAVKNITAREIGGHLRFLASDSMKGRDTTSPELRVAGDYLAAHLFGAGAEPLGDQGRDQRTYFQKFPLEVVTPKEEGTELTLILEKGGSKRSVPCKLATDFVVFPGGIVPGEIEAPVVFAGYGRIDPERNIDDYKDLDVKDRFVLVYSGQPGAARGGNEVEDGECAAMSGALGKRENAQKKGAIGVLEIQPPGRETPIPEVPLTGRNLGFSHPNMTLGHAKANVPAITLSDPIRDLLVDACGLTNESKGQSLANSGVRRPLPLRRHDRTQGRPQRDRLLSRRRSGKEEGNRHLQRALRPRGGRRKRRDLQRL